MAAKSRAQCSRCNRVQKIRSLHSIADWNGMFEEGRLVALICPTCQTADEYTEAEVNEIAYAGYAVKVSDDGVHRFESRGDNRA